MRKLRIVVAASKGALPVLAFASLVPASSCGDGQDHVVVSTAGGASARDAAGDTALFGGAGGSLNFPDVQGSGGTGGGFSDAALTICEGRVQETYIVDVPPAGVPAEPGQICAVNMQPPIASNRAARVTLTRYSPSFDLAQGLITLAPELTDSVVGMPVLRVVDASDPELLSMQVSQITALSGAFSFHATFPGFVPGYANGSERLTVRATLEIACADGSTRLVEASTQIDLCEGLGGADWVSSGDECTICRVIAEMAPSPIVPDTIADGLPLAQALRLRLVALARVANRVVLLAENDGGCASDYEWQAGTGELERLAPDIVVWTLPDGPGPHFVQAAVLSERGAAVASYAWDEAA